MEAHETAKQFLESLMGAIRDSVCVCDEIRWRHRQKELAALYSEREKNKPESQGVKFETLDDKAPGLHVLREPAPGEPNGDSALTFPLCIEVQSRCEITSRANLEASILEWPTKRYPAAPSRASTLSNLHSDLGQSPLARHRLSLLSYGCMRWQLSGGEGGGSCCAFARAALRRVSLFLSLSFVS
ncbi:hypothetical protein CI102_1019 [Trichoderma harzianum]|nr:hypothetical protein CI102_1019 [Trichoderma harzianum]